MWYNSFRHLVKRSNRIRIQKKLLVLLQEAQLIYVVNFLYIFPLISLPCCPLPPFFFTTLRDSDVPAATSTGGERLWWCQPRHTGSVCCSSGAHSLWESPSPGVLSNHIPPARSRVPHCLIDSTPDSTGAAREASRGKPSCRSGRKMLSRSAQSWELWLVFSSDSRVACTLASASALDSDELITGPSREAQTPGWARSSHQQCRHTHTFWESRAGDTSTARQSNGLQQQTVLGLPQGIRRVNFFLMRHQRTGSPAV